MPDKQKKYAYKFTAEFGSEDFPTLGTTLTEAGQIVETDEPIEHARLKQIRGPKEEEKEQEKEKEKESVPSASPIKGKEGKE